MNIRRFATALLLLAALGTAGHAPSERIREQVKAGLAEVVRSDDVLGDGDSKVRDLLSRLIDRAGGGIGLGRE